MSTTANDALKVLPRTVAVTFRSHHNVSVVQAGLQLLEVQTQNDLERERGHGETADEELLQLYELRLGRIAEARRNLLGTVTP